MISLVIFALSGFVCAYVLGRFLERDKQLAERWRLINLPKGTGDQLLVLHAELSKREREMRMLVTALDRLRNQKAEQQRN